MKSSMVRFVAAYRWELLLFLVAPAVARLANDLTSSVFDSYFDSGWLEGRFSYFGHGAVGNLVTAVVLGVCYARVRGLGRELLTLVWGYKLTVSAIFALFWFASAAIVPSFVDPQTDIAAYALVVTVNWTLVSLVQLPVLVVFARRASRLSLTHAFFLFLITLHYALPVLQLALWVLPDSLTWGTSFFVVSFAVSVASCVGSLVVACVLAWLLGNFESRGDSFRKRLVLMLLAAQAVQVVQTGVWFLLVRPLQGGVTFVMLVALILGSLALIYLFRDRSPQPLRSH